MNHRIVAAGEMLARHNVKSVLDIGCRGAEARAVLPPDVEYFGNDLIQNSAATVAYVGDALTVPFGRTFDCVMALDVVEHLDDPYRLMARMFELSERHVLVSLPNVYDLVHKYKFLFQSTLGGKYEFDVDNRLDRHRWIMNYDEIHRFFRAQAAKHHARVSTRDLYIAERSAKIVSRAAAAMLKSMVGKKVMTQTVIALFIK
jgi:SAM-dependent methyltransferase